jgi:nickel-type superoxide dismutase maturation protease
MPATDWRELVLWLLRQRRRVCVAGGSMLPLLPDGAEVLVDPSAYLDRSPSEGDVVVAYHPDRADMSIIKRIVAVLPNHTCILIGDNSAESIDSRQFGTIAINRIVGKVTSRFSH